MIQTTFSFINQYKASQGIFESYEETFNSLMESPRATYMGDGWFTIYEKIEEGHTSNWEPPT